LRHSEAKIVFASSLPSRSATSIGSISVDHTSTNGSGRVRHVRGSFVAEGSGPRCHFRAVLSLIDAADAAASIVLFSIRFFLSKRTCLSLTIRGSTSPGTRPELSAPHRRTGRPHGRSTGKSNCRQAAEVVVADHAASTRAEEGQGRRGGRVAQRC